jgi:hypothetical protein
MPVILRLLKEAVPALAVAELFSMLSVVLSASVGVCVKSRSVVPCASRADSQAAEGVGRLVAEDPLAGDDVGA